MTYRRYSGHGPRYMSRFFSKDPRTSLRVADGAEKKEIHFYGRYNSTDGATEEK